MKTTFIRWFLVTFMLSLTTASCRGGETPAPKASEPSSPPAPVEVFNALGRGDVCADVVTRLPAGTKATVQTYRDSENRIYFGEKTTKVLADDACGAQARAIAAALGVGSAEPAPGTKTIKVIVAADAAAKPPAGAPTDGVYIKKSELAVYYLEGGVVAKTWPCAIGKPETPTPAGTYKVTVTLEKPTWYWQGKAIPPGPDNGLGDWFIGISKKGYGLHGTNEPDSIGSAASHGCIRMYNEDAGALVAFVKAGTPVVISE